MSVSWKLVVRTRRGMNTNMKHLRNDSLHLIMLRNGNTKVSA